MKLLSVKIILIFFYFILQANVLLGNLKEEIVVDSLILKVSVSQLFKVRMHPQKYFVMKFPKDRPLQVILKAIA